MSTEVSMLLAQAAPTPSHPLDVSSIMRRGDRVRAGRMLATVVVIPVIVAALWAGAHARVGSTTPNLPVGNPACEWQSQKLQAFLDPDATLDEVIGVAARARRLEHVESVEWNDLFERSVRRSGDLSRLMHRLGRRDFPAWLDVRLVDPRYADEVANELVTWPLVDDVPRGLRSAGCRYDAVEEENFKLIQETKRLRDANDQLSRRIRRVLDRLEAKGEGR